MSQGGSGRRRGRDEGYNKPSGLRSMLNKASAPGQSQTSYSSSITGTSSPTSTSSNAPSSESSSSASSSQQQVNYNRNFAFNRDNSNSLHLSTTSSRTASSEYRRPHRTLNDRFRASQRHRLTKTKPIQIGSAQQNDGMGLSSSKTFGSTNGSSRHNQVVGKNNKHFASNSKGLSPNLHKQSLGIHNQKEYMVQQDLLLSQSCPPRTPIIGSMPAPKGSAMMKAIPPLSLPPPSPSPGGKLSLLTRFKQNHHGAGNNSQTNLYGSSLAGSPRSRVVEYVASSAPALSYMHQAQRHAQPTEHYRSRQRVKKLGKHSKCVNSDTSGTGQQTFTGQENENDLVQLKTGGQLAEEEGEGEEQGNKEDIAFPEQGVPIQSTVTDGTGINTGGLDEGPEMEIGSVTAMSLLESYKESFIRRQSKDESEGRPTQNEENQTEGNGGNDDGHEDDLNMEGPVISLVPPRYGMNTGDTRDGGYMFHDSEFTGPQGGGHGPPKDLTREGSEHMFHMDSDRLHHDGLHHLDDDRDEDHSVTTNSNQGETVDDELWSSDDEFIARRKTEMEKVKRRHSRNHQGGMKKLHGELSGKEKAKSQDMEDDGMFSFDV